MSFGAKNHWKGYLPLFGPMKLFESKQRGPPFWVDWVNLSRRRCPSIKTCGITLFCNLGLGMEWTGPGAERQKKMKGI